MKLHKDKARSWRTCPGIEIAERGGNPVQEQSRPNILLMICHDLGRHLGCYGVDGLETPNINELARRGIRFTDYFCTAPQCSPSRGSIMTGRVPHNNGLMGLAHLGWELDNDIQTLPRVLTDHGYETYLFGLQHEARSRNVASLGYQHVGRQGKAWEVADDVTSFLEGRDSPLPFYASVGFFEPHRPYDQPEYTPDNPSKISVPSYLPDVPGVRQEVGQLQGMIRALDTAVGQILTTLQGTGLWDDTLVIFTTDHGVAMPRAKGTLYDPGVGTALIMHGSDIAHGQVESSLLSNVDLLPTILEYVGAPLPGGIDGRSFLPLLQGAPYEVSDHVHLEVTWHDRYNPTRGIRTERYKYIRSFGGRPLVYIPADIYDGPSGKAVRDEYYGSQRPEEELHDLESDPLERSNVITHPEYEGVAEKLRKQLQRWMEATNDPLLRGPVASKEEPQAPYWNVVDNDSPFE